MEKCYTIIILLKLIPSLEKTTKMFYAVMSSLYKRHFYSSTWTSYFVTDKSQSGDDEGQVHHSGKVVCGLQNRLIKSKFKDDDLDE